jgi:hypothetical protein
VNGGRQHDEDDAEDEPHACGVLHQDSSPNVAAGEAACYHFKAS